MMGQKNRSCSDLLTNFYRTKSWQKTLKNYLNSSRNIILCCKSSWHRRFNFPIGRIQNLFKSGLNIQFDFWRVSSNQNIFSFTVKSIRQPIKSVKMRISKNSGATWRLVSNTILRSPPFKSVKVKIRQMYLLVN